MKGFIITSVLTLILILCLYFNWSYVNSVTNEVMAILETISEFPSDDNEEKIKKLEEYWNSQKIPMRLSVNYREIDEITNLISSIKAANESEDSSQLSIHINLLHNAISSITRLEKVSIENLI